jgi:serpin B
MCLLTGRVSKEFVMKNYSWLVALAPLAVLACGSNSSNPAQTSLPEAVKSSLTYNSNPTVSTAAQQAVTNDLNNFGLEVLQSLAPTGQNFAVSPVSGFVALTMTADGAQGTTADEMKTVLYPDVALTDIQAATNWLEQGVKDSAQPMEHVDDAGKQVALNLANDVFVQTGLSIQQPFLDNLMTNYDSGIELVDFKDNSNGATTEINNWVASETNNLIPKLLSPGSLDSLTRLVLVNALYLNASWLTAFDPNKTQAQTFNGVNGTTSTDFMNANLTLNYATGTEWAAVDIPYFGGSLVMTAVLPDSGQFDTVKASLNAAWFASFDAAVQQQQVGLGLPKFTLTGSTVSWKQTLQTLGMITLFDGSTCNLSGITQQEQLYVSDVLQQVYVAVAEKGTVAAAATAVTVETMAVAMPPPTTITFDRPFLFFVREHGGPILFAGQVVTLP